MTEDILKKMAQSIIDGDSDAAVALAKESIAASMDPLEAISGGFVAGVNRVGDAFARGEAFLPELVMAGEAMKLAVATLDPELKKRGAKRQILGKVVIGTVEGDIHEIGKSLVATMLGASGFEMVRQGEVIEELEKEGLRNRIKVMVGGAPITRDWVTTIRADGYSEDAIGAVVMAKKLVSTS